MRPNHSSSAHGEMQGVDSDKVTLFLTATLSPPSMITSPIQTLSLRHRNRSRGADHPSRPSSFHAVQRLSFALSPPSTAFGPSDPHRPHWLSFLANTLSLLSIGIAPNRTRSSFDCHSRFRSCLPSYLNIVTLPSALSTVTLLIWQVRQATNKLSLAASEAAAPH